MYEPRGVVNKEMTSFRKNIVEFADFVCGNTRHGNPFLELDTSKTRKGELQGRSHYRLQRLVIQPFVASGQQE